MLPSSVHNSEFTIHNPAVARVWVFKINTKRGWKFDQYFRARARGPVAMGDEGWIKSASSLRYLREEVRKGDLFLCYETDRKQMVGVARAASDGRGRDLMRKVSLIDFCPPREAVRLENPLARNPDLDHILAFTPQRGRGTVQPINNDEFARLRRIMLHKNPGQAQALKRILSFEDVLAMRILSGGGGRRTERVRAVTDASRSYGEFLAGETARCEVANVEEAVELAQELKSKRRFDWFRGQVSDWPPRSSLLRVGTGGDQAKYAEAQHRMAMFAEWAGGEPDLKYLLESEHVHDFCAIMQHYGVPTHYIDFTNDPAVAGFFAADTAKPPAEGLSCIYCLNTEHLKRYWDKIKKLKLRPRAIIEVVTVDVRNLWRLQAQQGTFVFANYNWEVDYPLDRIVFPYSGYPAYPTRERIYPVNKSPLEQALDRYFSLESARFWFEEQAQWVKEAQARGQSASVISYETWPSGYCPEAFVDSARMVPLESWRPEAMKNWQIDPVEKFFETVGPTLRLKLRPTADPQELRRMVSFGVKQILRSEPGVRSKTVNWDFAGLAGQVSAERLNDLFRPAWNGMRRLPYLDEEIADALGSIAALLVIGFGQKAEVEEFHRQLFSQCFGDSIPVGFTYRTDGSGSDGHASRQGLANAMRPDMADLLLADHQKRVGDVQELFQVIYNPSLMFEFEPFKSLFAREIIPAQVLRGHGETGPPTGRDVPALFNPAHLKIFGNL